MMMTDSDTYNYARFDEHVERGDERREFGAFPDHLHVGDPAPNFSVTPLEGDGPFEIGDLWRRRDVVLEFGSFT